MSRWTVPRGPYVFTSERSSQSASYVCPRDPVGAYAHGHLGRRQDLCVRAEHRADDMGDRGITARRNGQGLALHAARARLVPCDLRVMRRR